MKDINQFLRPSIRNLKPYSSARDEFSGSAAVFLDANENPFNEPYNRYPDPHQRELKKKIASIKNVPADRIFLGNGSDEAIDLLIRAFCEPGHDNIISIAPTYGMYRVAAGVNNVEVREVLLTPDYQLNTRALFEAADSRSKLLFLCSPNNPTGNLFAREDISEVANRFQGVVVLDEAYIDFAPGKSLLPVLNDFPNVVVLQTLSKAWGMAGIRLGMAFAQPAIIEVLSRIKYPYNVNSLTQSKALELLDKATRVTEWVNQLLREREQLAGALKEFDFTIKVYPSDANFLLVKTKAPKEIYSYLVEKGIIVRDRSGVALCEGCLRITVGSPTENLELLEALQGFEILD